MKIIQYWADPIVPEEIQQLTDSWKDMNPQCEHKIYNHTDAAEFIRNNFNDEICEAFLSIKLAAMAADVFRVAYILKNGGFYIDCGSKCLAPLNDTFLSNPKLTLMIKWHGNIWNGLIYAKESNNEVLEAIWNEIKNNILEKKEGNVSVLTGPLLFKSIVNKIENKDKVLLYNQETLEGTFTLIRKMKHRGATHWSRMQGIEPLYYNTTFDYQPKPIPNIEKLQKKHIIIHMGQHATDVSYLQAYLLFLNKKSNHFCYPETGQVLNSHNEVAQILSSTNENDINLFFDNFYKEVAHCPEKIIIISSELFSSFNPLRFNKIKSTRLWQRLNQLILPFQSKEIIYQIEEQCDAIERRVHSIIQEGSIKKININMLIENPTLDYSLFNTTLQKYFSDTKISYKIFSPALNYHMIFNHLFGHIIDIDHDMSWSWKGKRNIVIPSNILANLFLSINNTDYSLTEKIRLKNIFLKYLPNENGISFLSKVQRKEIARKFIAFNNAIDISFTEANMLFENEFKKIREIDIESLISNYFPHCENQEIKHVSDLFMVLLEKNL